MTEHISLMDGLIAERRDDAPAGSVYSIELPNPTTGRITVLRVHLPHTGDPHSEVRLAAAWRGLDPRPLDALAPRWLVEAAGRLVPELQSVESARATSPAPEG
jgi:hypothetical protein